MTNDHKASPEFAYLRTEYGLIEDRRSRGLGFCLMGVYLSPGQAQWALDERASKMPAEWDYSHEIKVRQVQVTDWQPMAVAGEHVPSCNDRCSGDDHHLLSSPSSPEAGDDRG